VRLEADPSDFKPPTRPVLKDVAEEARCSYRVKVPKSDKNGECMQKHFDFVLLGGGPASVSAAETLRAEGAKGSILLVSEEAARPASRRTWSCRRFARPGRYGALTAHLLCVHIVHADRRAGCPSSWRGTWQDPLHREQAPTGKGSRFKLSHK
jgi:hypothetical protein